MPYAVLGVRRDAQDDTDDAIRCLMEGFASHPEAAAYAHANSEELMREHSELYVEKHDGEGWRPLGGRCYLQAYRTLTEDYDQLIELGYCGDTPQLVHGYCLRFKTVGDKPVPSGHAWIEGNGCVLDCGSYIRKSTQHDKRTFYRNKEVFAVHSYTRDEALRHFDTLGIPFPWNPPPVEFVRERTFWESLQRDQD